MIRNMERYEKWIADIIADIAVIRHRSAYNKIDDTYTGENYSEIEIDSHFETYETQDFDAIFCANEEKIYKALTEREHDGDMRTLDEDDYALWYIRDCKGKKYLVISLHYTADEYSEQDQKENAGCEESHRRRDENA